MSEVSPILVPKRRWSRFSLRGLLVLVTLACVWLGYEASIARHRIAMRQRLENAGATVFEHDLIYSQDEYFAKTHAYLTEWTGKNGANFSSSDYPRLGDGRYTVSYVRHLIGDRVLDTICFTRPLTDQDREALTAFPEAEVGAPLPTLSPSTPP